MKKLMALLVVLSLLLALSGCGAKGEKYTIEIMIPAGSTEAFVYSKDVIRPTGKKITISSGAGLGDTEVILKPVDETVETGYVATYLTRGMPVEFDTADVEDEWFRIGVSVQNESDRGPIAVSVEVEGVEIGKEEPITPTGYPSGELQQPQIMYDGLIYYYFATGFDEPLPDGYACVGEVAEVDNVNIPQNDFQGARVELKQEVYASEANSDTIYLKYKQGYAQFTVKENPETQNEVLKFLKEEYDLQFTLWGPVDNDLYVFHVYPDHADYECHILMPENTDDVEQYWNDLEWEIIDDELIIKNHVGGEWSEAFKIDISMKTATSAKTGRVYQIYNMDASAE